jgi:hypothetical protein
VQAEDLLVPVGVDAGREQSLDVDDPAALTDLEHEHVSRDEGVGPASSGGVRRACTWASKFLAIADTSAASAWRRRSTSQSGKYDPVRSFGIANSIAPARVSHSRRR